MFNPTALVIDAFVAELHKGSVSTYSNLEPDYPGDPWHYVLSRIVTAARAFGLQAIDGPYAAIRDLEGYRELLKSLGLRR